MSKKLLPTKNLFFWGLGGEDIVDKSDLFNYTYNIVVKNAFWTIKVL